MSSSKKAAPVSIVLIIVFLAFCVGFGNSCGKDQQKNKREPNIMSIRKTLFGKTPNGVPIYLYALDNGKMKVQISNYGGIVTSITVPDKNGNCQDVVLGFNTLDKYLAGHPYFGALIGRYGNRIAKGQFSLSDKKYQLATNNGKNHLHGGDRGFDKVIWEAEKFSSKNEAGLKLRYLSKDGEENYPGNLLVDVTYTLTDENELKIYYEAKTDKPTPVNLTHHSYFNLQGEGEGHILNHILAIHADRYTPVDDELIPTGELKEVDHTAMDFRQGKTIGKDIKEVKGGYDHNYVLNDWNRKLRLVATVVAPSTGIVMDVLTTEPGLQFYSGNFLDGTLVGKSGKPYLKHGGFCLETQHFPDSPNQPDFPSTILQPGTTYTHTTIYRFSVKN